MNEPRELQGSPDLMAVLGHDGGSSAEALGAWLVTDPSGVHFAENGHGYRGSEQFAQAVLAGHATAVAIDDLVDAEVWTFGDLAWVLAGVADVTATRVTAVLVRRPEGWRVVHTHLSKASRADRPGGI
jgi:hypothetical protein